MAAAGAKVSPPIGAAALRNLVTANALSGQILQIQARAPQSRYAEELSNAVRASYVNYMSQLASTSIGPGVTALQQESDLFTQQIKNLQTQIDSVSARISSEGAATSAGQQDASLLTSLQNEQGQVSAQLNSVTGQIAAAQLADGSAASTTRILQNATLQPSSKVESVVTAGIVGLTVGLLGAVVVVLVRLQRGRRLRLRDDIASRWRLGHRGAGGARVHHAFGLARVSRTPTTCNRRMGSAAACCTRSFVTAVSDRSST